MSARLLCNYVAGVLSDTEEGERVLERITTDPEELRQRDRAARMRLAEGFGEVQLG